MKKNLFVYLMCTFSFFMCFGCNKNVVSEKNVSERVETYFNGVANGFKASISSGQRENPYIYNGVTAPFVDFAVLTIVCDCANASIDVQITINEKCQNIRLEVDTVTGHFLTDLETKLKEGDVVTLNYAGESLTLSCMSKDFNLSWKDSFEKGMMVFKDDLQKLCSSGTLMAEIYLRVLDNAEDEFNRIYWYFYVYAQNGTTYSCVIDPKSGEVVVKN